MLYTFKKSKTNIGLQKIKKWGGQKWALQQVILHRTMEKTSTRQKLLEGA